MKSADKQKVLTEEPKGKPKAEPSADGDPDLIAAIEVIKPLVDALGVEKVKRIADLLG